MPYHNTITIRNKTFKNSLFLAPMLGITNSAFRRLISDLGGCGALFTEMLSAKAILGVEIENSPFTKKRITDGDTIYQIRFNDTDNIKTVIKRLSVLNPDGLDINLGCPAPEIKKNGAGIELFRNLKALEQVLNQTRELWDKPFSVKSRIWENEKNWELEFEKRLRIFEKYNVDFISVHPRLFNEKLKKKSRWKLFNKIASMTDIPIIANGDITNLSEIKEDFSKTKGIMLGRIAVVKPWIFQEFLGKSVNVDYKKVWEDFYNYTLEDFPPEKAIGRIKEFTGYYSNNFFFGHSLYSAVQGTKSLDKIYNNAIQFLSRDQKIIRNPSVRTS